MTEVPDPAPLDPPPGNAAALEDVVEDVAGAGYWLTVLSTDLSGSAAAAPGWRGDDAAAAAAQVAAVAGIARQCSVAVGTAAHRLRLHYELRCEARRQIDALREEQKDDFAATWQRLSSIGNPRMALMTGAPEWVAVVEELRAGEAARRRRHAALMEEVTADAAATVAVLTESSAVVGGRGVRGDGDRVLAHLAAELPGWGDRELTARGRALAEELRYVMPPEERDELARRALALAASPAFAAALLSGLGRGGVSDALWMLGDGVVAPDSALARLLATVLGAALSADVPDVLLGQVLDADYVDEADPGPDPDRIVFGMAAVLTVTATLPSGGLPPRTVVGWSRQILAREHALVDVPRELRVQPPTGTSVDPLTAVLRALDELRSPAAAAAVLGEHAAWPPLLARSWEDGGAALAGVVALAAADPGQNGEMAARRGLEALGAGLADGDPEDWTVDPGTATAVSPQLGDAVAAHVAVATGVLGLGVDGDLGGRAGDLLRGLGYLTLDEGAARTVGAALRHWAGVQPVPVEVTCSPIPLPVVVVPSAFLAVREYGQRLAHTLHGFEEKEEAELHARRWNWTIGLLVEVPKRTVVGAGLGVVEGYAAMAFDVDGRWDNGPDDGLRFERDRAAGAVLSLTPAEDGELRGVLAGQARAVFDRTSEALGTPRPPVSPELDPVGPLKDAAVDAGLDRGVDAARDAFRKAVGSASAAAG